MKDNMLYIDGELVDMDDKTKITLNYKSNIFSDISKIVSNNSYTIKLPNTVRNQRIFQHAELPASGSKYPRVYHKARYFRNGVEILPDALAVLISSGDSFDVALTWGNASVFEPLVKSAKKLNELKDSGEYLVWNKESGYGNYEQGDYLYSKANYGVDMNADGANVWALPAARIPFIIGLIEKEYGIKINIPYPQNTLTNKLLTLCDTKKESDVVFSTNPVELELVKTIGAEYVTKFDFKKKDNIQNEKYGTIDKLGQVSSYLPVREMEDTKLLINITALFDTSILDPSSTTLVVIQEEAGGVRKETPIQGYASLSGLGIDYSGNLSIKTTKDSRFSFELRVQQAFTFIDKVSLFSVKFYMKSERDIEYNERYPIVPNLPNIKVVDFLKNITQMVGLFAFPNISDKSVSFFNVDKIDFNKRYAIDVTTRVIAETKDNRPRGVKYTIDGIARNNRFDYKKNDELKGDYSGVITVADETIDFEKDAVKMEFGASDEYRGLAEVPIYEYDKDGKINEKNIDARIFAEEGWSGKSELHFDSETSTDSLAWKELLLKYYQGYQKIVSSPIIINEKIELTDIELKTLDMTVPFYLGQYGRCYAIISIKAEDTGLCECELLQLEV